MSQIFHIDKRALKSNLNLFVKRKIGKLRVRKRMKKWLEKNVSQIECDCKIIKYKPGQYYLLLTTKKEVKEEHAICNSVSLDPGVRTFQTFYSSDGICGKLGDNIVDDQLLPIAKRIDKLDSVKTKCKKIRTKRNISRRQHLLRTKIKNIVNDLHYKIIHFLCKNFQTIIASTFEVKNMTQLTNKSRTINSETTRKMLTLSHYKFKVRLIHKAKMMNRKLIIHNESYTSKTCGRCGELNETLNSKKVFECKKCNLCIDRDINGARNMMIRTCSK
jgi:putative transposase